MRKFDYYGGVFVSSIALAAAVMGAELFAPFKSALAAVFTHHWPGKVFIVVVAFILGGYFLRRSEKSAWYATIGSLAAILVFFIIHFYL